jgi:sugar phosphate isomerase/epimerase
MKLTRREFVAAAAMQVPGGGVAPREKPRTRPAICLASAQLTKLHYSELGGVLHSLGFDGCDLAVRQGGHVEPERAPADLLRAIEGIRGEGVDVPMISTAFLSAAEPWARSVIGIAGTLGVPYFTAGGWSYAGTDNIEARMMDARREIAGLASLGRTYEIAFGVHNRAGEFAGGAVWDTRILIADLDPRWVGYFFDPCQATAGGGNGGWLVALKLALARIKMVAVEDFYWARDAAGKWQMKMCPLGEGMVDWPRVFAELARVRFTGPLSLRLQYQPKDEVGAMARDLAFLKKQVAAAYTS